MRCKTKLKRLLGNEPRLAERIDVYSLNAIGLRLYKAHVGQATIASREILRDLVKEAARAVAATNSVCIFSSPSGSRWWRRGSWRTGRVSRCRAPRQKDAASGSSAHRDGGKIRARADRAEKTRTGHAR